MQRRIAVLVSRIIVRSQMDEKVDQTLIVRRGKHIAERVDVRQAGGQTLHSLRRRRRASLVPTGKVQRRLAVLAADVDVGAVFDRCAWTTTVCKMVICLHVARRPDRTSRYPARPFRTRYINNYFTFFVTGSDNFRRCAFADSKCCKKLRHIRCSNRISNGNTMVNLPHVFIGKINDQLEHKSQNFVIFFSKE